MRFDLPTRLRIDAAFCEACDRPGDPGMAALLREAADEIERLTQERADWRDAAQSEAAELNRRTHQRQRGPW